MKKYYKATKGPEKTFHSFNMIHWIEKTEPAIIPASIGEIRHVYKYDQKLVRKENKNF